ncbi:MAG: hypothetical protein ACFE8M_03430 [Candidatus Hermodarchaeota archaeon]
MVKITGGDGNSLDDAIIISDCSHFEGIDQEYIILKKKFGNYKLIKQSLIEESGKIYDFLEIILEDGGKTEVYFEITNFFGIGF